MQNIKKTKIITIIVILCLILFLFFYYKTFKTGNNISNKEEEKIIDYILNNISEYEADIEVTVISNKTENIYKMKQEVKEDFNSFEVYFPEEMKGFLVQIKENTLKISNASLSLEKIYKEYGLMLDNSMFLNVFINDYKTNKSEYDVKNDEIILKTEMLENTSSYARYKELYINKETGEIKKLIIKDNTKNVRVYIKYNNIEIK